MREFRQQLVSALLVILTVAAVVAAAINFQQQSRFALPDDGVAWVDQVHGDSEQRGGGLCHPGESGDEGGGADGRRAGVD